MKNQLSANSLRSNLVWQVRCNIFWSASHDADIGGVLLVQRFIVRYIFQIFLRVAVENQVGVTHRIIVNQVVQCRTLIHIVCVLILNSGAVNRNHAAIGKLQFDTNCVHVELTGK